MHILFAGTPAFAARALDALLGVGHTVALVLTQPDRPAGRGQRSATSAVKDLARHHRLEVLQPISLKSEDVQSYLQSKRAQALIVAAYGLILPKAVLGLFPLGCINIHASLLPRWRGAAPIQRAIMAGDDRSGVSIMQMDEGLDTGPILLCEAVTITAEETGGSLQEKLADLGARLIVQAVRQLEVGTAERIPQPTEGATYAKKIAKEEARIQWHRPAIQIHRQIRAFNPVPVAFTTHEGELLRIWRASIGDLEPSSAKPGQVRSASARGIDVACGSGDVRVLELQRAGGKRQAAGEFLRGKPISAGAVLGN